MDVQKAFVIFKGAGRTRVRIPALQYDKDGLARCVQALAEVQGVSAVSASAVTGTILVQHDGGRDAVLACLKSGGFPAVDAVTPKLADNRLPSWRHVAAIIFLALAVRQFNRGQVFGPASSLVAAAFAMLSRGKGYENF